MPVDRQHVPTPSLVLLGDVLGVDLLDLGRELDVVGIVVHDEIREPQVPGDAAHHLRNFLLDTAVGDIGVSLVGHPLAETGHHEALGNGSAQRHGMPLSQRAGGIFHSAHHIHLGVAGGHAAPLPQRLQVLGRIMPGQGQRRIEHRRHVARVEKEPVAVGVGHVVGVVAQELGEEHGHEIGTAHGTARVPRLGFLDHGGRQDTDVVGDTRKFGIRRHRYYCC